MLCYLTYNTLCKFDLFSLFGCMNADSPIGNLPTDQPRIPSPHDQPKSTGANVDQKDMTFLGESSECIQIQ